MDLMSDKHVQTPVKVGELITLLNGLKVDMSMIAPPEPNHHTQIGRQIKIYSGTY